MYARVVAWSATHVLAGRPVVPLRSGKQHEHVQRPPRAAALPHHIVAPPVDLHCHGHQEALLVPPTHRLWRYLGLFESAREREISSSPAGATLEPFGTAEIRLRKPEAANCPLRAYTRLSVRSTRIAQPLSGLSDTWWLLNKTIPKVVFGNAVMKKNKKKNLFAVFISDNC